MRFGTRTDASIVVQHCEFEGTYQICLVVLDRHLNHPEREKAVAELRMHDCQRSFIVAPKPRRLHVERNRPLTIATL